ncbi:MAG TPA: hypothetical protein VK203_05110 [Nostocaceae cyanobacterium]|nr:hypothetical protein [Nostocaceae cyanobacterium]
MKSQLINSIILALSVALITNLGLSPANANQHSHQQHEQHQQNKKCKGHEGHEGHKECQGHERHKKSNQSKLIQEI